MAASSEICRKHVKDLTPFQFASILVRIGSCATTVRIKCMNAKRELSEILKYVQICLNLQPSFHF